jgi:hypothetical protein
MIRLPNGFAVAGEYKIFDPRDPETGSGGAEVLDATLAKRSNQWWMFLAGQAAGIGATDLFSASLPVGAPLSAIGWSLTRDESGQLVPLAGRDRSEIWDGRGGRHCPSYVKGWDPHTESWVERIYYAGSAENLWGPYTIGFLECDGERWADQANPVFLANADWERGSVYEPNLIYFDGKWRLWYVAGSNHEDYLVQCYAESADGKSGWSEHSVFAPAEMKMFDFCVRQCGDRFEAVYALVSMAEPSRSETGLWWCTADHPSATLEDWSNRVQIATAEDCGWHKGPWKPSLHYDEAQPEAALIFFDGLYRTADPGPFPFAFTLGCLKLSSTE